MILDSNDPLYEKKLAAMQSSLEENLSGSEEGNRGMKSRQGNNLGLIASDSAGLPRIK